MCRSEIGVTDLNMEIKPMKTLYETLSSTQGFFLIAGPCVIENETITNEIAKTLKQITDQLNISLVFKASFLKANRTSANSFTGPGISEGLKILKQIKQDYDLPILTDVHETHEIEQVALIADIIQIPAFLCRQTSLIVEAAKSQRIINLKKGQFIAPEDMQKQVEKVLTTNNNQIILTERGTTFGYHNLVVDFRSFAIMKKTGFPVVFDVTHSMQQPSIGEVSGGTPDFVPMMSKAAIATGCVDGLFIETHPNPIEALSDANTQFKLDLLYDVLKENAILSRFNSN